MSLVRMRAGAPGGWLAALLVGGLVWAQAAWALGPLEREDPLVAKGREAYQAGRYEEALEAFESAQKQRPGDPAVEFNRADALMKLGRLDEASEAFRQVAQSNREDLRQKATYNLGNLHALKGERQEALKAWRKALAMNPNDEQARHNYEVLLRNLPPPSPPSPDGGQDGGGDGGSDGGSDGGRPDAGPGDAGVDGGHADGGSDAGQDGGMDGGTADAGPADGGPPDGGQGDAGADGGQGDGGEGDGGQSPGGDEPTDGGMDGGSSGEAHEHADGGMDQAEIDRQEAERLLDAMKQNEKNLQLWRFQQKKRPRKPDEKDW